MTRKEIIATVAEKAKLSRSDVERVLYWTFDKVLTEALAEGVTVSINDFGKFIPKVREAHVGRNPATGASIQVPEKMVISFKPSTVLKGSVN